MENTENYKSDLRKHYERIEVFAKSKMPDWKKTEIYEILTEYFAGALEFEARHDSYDLKKGLLIVGDVGTGKTRVMMLFKQLMAANKDITKHFKMESSRQVIRNYTIEGGIVMNRLGKHSKDIICFDDLGLEEVNSKMYGNNANVMGEILLDRYDLFVYNNIKTYATSNLNADSLEGIYGERVRDRLKEMMNYVVIKGESFRK